MQSSYSDKNEAGVDEAGRGCLAGPVVAAAVVLPPGFTHPLINDSKTLSEIQRLKAVEIIRNHAVSIGIGVVDNQTIDKLNILKATFNAMNIAIKQLMPSPDLLLIDGNRFINDTNIPFKCMIKGDARFYSIAAASIIAKTHRDELMKVLDKEFPVYGWYKNKAYPTASHRKAIGEYGLSPYHRMSFSFQMKIEF